MTAQLAQAQDTPEPFTLPYVMSTTVQRVSRSGRATSSPAPSGREISPMNPLARLILGRKEELGLTWDEIAERGEFSSHTIVYQLAMKTEHKMVPRSDTLRRVAKALNLPMDVIQRAAIEAAGFSYRNEDIPTTLGASDDLRIVAAVFGQLDDNDRTVIRRMVETYAAEVLEQKDKGGRASGSA